MLAVWWIAASNSAYDQRIGAAAGSPLRRNVSAVLLPNACAELRKIS